MSAEPAPAEAAPTDAAPPDAAPTEAPPADTPTIDPARTHLMLRGGMHIYPDSAFHALADARNRGAVEIAADITLHHRLALGLAFHNGAITGDLYGEPTAFSEASLHLSALYRLRPHPALSAYARLGPTIDWYHLEIGTGRNAHTVDDWSIGARAALGAELWLLHRGWLPFETDPPSASPPKPSTTSRSTATGPTTASTPASSTPPASAGSSASSPDSDQRPPADFATNPGLRTTGVANSVWNGRF
ncbi:MAG: hypothetical protein R3F65_20140 [bacterium]